MTNLESGQSVYVKQEGIGASGHIEDFNSRGSHAYVVPKRGFWVRTDLLGATGSERPLEAWERGLARIRQGEEAWKLSRRPEGEE